jgi:hypothetical protein
MRDEGKERESGFILQPTSFILSASPLLLLVLGVRADHADRPLAADDLAVLTNTLHAGSDLHGTNPPAAGSLASTDRPAQAE